MEHKNIVATIYIKDGMAVKSPTELDDKSDVLELASVYDDSGIDKIICYDLSTDDEEHEKNILAIREINRNIQVKTAGGGNIKRLEDVKKLLYAGCVEVILNGSKLTQRARLNTGDHLLLGRVTYQFQVISTNVSVMKRG